jgi:hypothetical protein
MGEVDPAEGLPQSVEVRLNREALVRYNLPDILYPVPLSLISAAVGDGGELPFAEMLYALQQRSAESGQADWEALEPALDRLASLLAPDDDRLIVTAAGTSWWVEIGPVDLNEAIITIQRRETLIAAFNKCDDGRLRLTTYRPLDAKSARSVIGLAARPHALDGTVCMRENNWEYALDYSAGIGQYYAHERGEAHMSYWEYGLGIQHDRTLNPDWHALRDCPPRRAAVAAIELGVAYAFSDE